MSQPDLNQMLEDLKEEMSRLDAEFDRQMKSMGLSLEDLVPEKLPTDPEALRLLDTMKENALRAGQARAAQCMLAASPATHSLRPSRKGAIHL